ALQRISQVLQEFSRRSHCTARGAAATRRSLQSAPTREFRLENFPCSVGYQFNCGARAVVALEYRTLFPVEPAMSSSLILIEVERFDFALEGGCDRVTPQFAVRRQQAALDGQRLLVEVESVDALIMRQLGVDRLQSILDLLLAHIAGDERGQVPSPVPHHHA